MLPLEALNLKVGDKEAQGGKHLSKKTLVCLSQSELVSTLFKVKMSKVVLGRQAGMRSRSVVGNAHCSMHPLGPASVTKHPGSPETEGGSGMWDFQS